MDQHMDYATFKNKLPLKFNQQQEDAVKTIDGPVLLLAVPGSGKTTVLVARLANMILCRGIEPEKILTLTYTVAATNDMRSRFSRLFGAELGSKLEFKTINSVCAGIIKTYGMMIGRTAFSLESNEKALLGIISLLYQKYEGEYPTESEIKGVKTNITYIKNMMLNDDEIEALGREEGIHLAEIYKDYCAELRNHKKMDFDDQMIYAYNLLKKFPSLLQYYHRKYQYICVDEAQDTSRIQHEIIKLLASADDNLFMVGDEDQSIYGFRAAYPQAVLSFEKDHKHAKVLLMEENFRSLGKIVTSADAFVQKNKFRHKKHMKATRPAGSDIEEIVIPERKGQYQYLLNIAKNSKVQTAVLYRDNESAIPLVDLLERNSVPYSIRKAELAFFTNRVVLDIQNIMRFANQMDNTDLFEQIYYKLSMYVNRKTALEACAIAKQQKITVFSAIYRLSDIKPYIRESVKDIEQHFLKMQNEEPGKAISRILYLMGYSEYLKKAELSDKKLFVLKTIATKEKTIESFLLRVDELKNIIENKSSDESSKFILSTIHASKGLEYDDVYIIDVVDGIFPEDVPSDLEDVSREVLETYEEERRLFYVGVTRAKNNLHIFKVGKETTFINQFLHNKYPKPSKSKVMGSNSGRIAINHIKKNEPYKPSTAEIETYKSTFLTSGKIVKHKKFGTGRVISVDNEYVKIAFRGAEKKFNIKLLLEHDLISE